MTTPSATSHAGIHGDFKVYYYYTAQEGPGWYWIHDNGRAKGPFETSQAAFNHRKELIDASL